jgi:hypothetical protein
MALLCAYFQGKLSLLNGRPNFYPRALQGKIVTIRTEVVRSVVFRSRVFGIIGAGIIGAGIIGAGIIAFRSIMAAGSAFGLKITINNIRNVANDNSNEPTLSHGGLVAGIC